MAALRAAQPAIQSIIAAQRRLADQVGVAKRQAPGLRPDPTGVAAVAAVAQPLVDAVLRCATSLNPNPEKCARVLVLGFSVPSKTLKTGKRSMYCLAFSLGRARVSRHSITVEKAFSYQTCLGSSQKTVLMAVCCYTQGYARPLSYPLILTCRQTDSSSDRLSALVEVRRAVEEHLHNIGARCQCPCCQGIARTFGNTGNRFK